MMDTGSNCMHVNVPQSTATILELDVRRQSAYPIMLSSRRQADNEGSLEEQDSLSNQMGIRLLTLIKIGLDLLYKLSILVVDLAGQDNYR